MADINITETTIDINVTEQVIEILSPTGGYPLPSDIYSVFGRTGTIIATSGDYTTTQVTEGTNLYYTDVRAKASLSFAAGSGAYNSTTGIITIPTNNNQITNGAGYITSSALSTYVPYTGATNNLNLSTNNLLANNAFLGFSSITASGTQVVLTVASVPTYIVTGSGGQTIKLPDATTLPNGANYVFNNNQSSGAVLVNNNSNTLVVSIPSGGYCTLELTDNSISAGSWDKHFQAPSNVSWSTNTFDYAGSITSATWNGVAVGVNRGGTGQSTYTDGQLLIGNTTGNTLSKSTLTQGTGISITNGSGSITIASTITQYTDALARASISLTTTGTSGAATYSSSTGVLNIPQYSGGGGSMVYPAAGIAISTGTGWGTSITDYSANWNTAYTNRITSLTTTGSSGAATLTSNTLNIPNYTLAGLGGITLTSLSATTPITYNNTTGVFTITQASASANGYLASGDFTTFNNKQGAIILTTTGTSGAATLVGTTLNIPQYSGGGGSMAIGGTITSATAGSVLFADTSGVLAQDNANFFWDNTNKRLGLGTITLGSKFQVNGNAAIGYSASTAAPTNGLAVAGSVQINTAATGNFGASLLISQNSTNYAFEIKTTSAKTSTTLNKFMALSSSDATSPQYLEIGIVGAASNTNRYFQFQTSEYLIADSGSIVFQPRAGSVAIGTTTIGSKLQVNGNAAIGYSASTAAPTNGLQVAGAIYANLPSASNNDGFRVYAATTSGAGSQPAYAFYTAAGVRRFSTYIDISQDIYIVGNTSGSGLLVISQSGVVTIGNLAGTGSRAVIADATGVLSAPVSDISVKTNIESIGYGLKEILKMNPIWFNYIDEYKNFGETRQNGNIAQEMETIIPEAVFITPSTGKMGINYDQLHAVYIKAIQELKAEIDELKLKIK